MSNVRMQYVLNMSGVMYGPFGSPTAARQYATTKQAKKFTILLLYAPL